MNRLLLFLFLLGIATPSFGQALTPTQAALVQTAYVTDAAQRGKDCPGMVQELVTFILSTRATQITQLQGVISRQRAGVTNSQNTFNANSTASLNALNAEGTSLDGVLSALPTIP